MDTPIKLQSVDSSTAVRKTTHKKDKLGRWSSAESYLFQSMLERYGKNWKKIHYYMKNRSLSQIRSHAQKYFDKVGPKRVEEFERRAKLLEAYETLENEKRLRETTEAASSLQENKAECPVKQEEESPPTGGEDSKMNGGLKESPLQEPLIKEQENPSHPQEGQRVMVQQMPAVPVPCFPFLDGSNGINGGFLMQFLNQNYQTFNHYQGMQPFIDNAGFNMFYQRQ